MAEIAVHLLAANAPVNGLADDPEITIQDAAGTEVVADAAMTDRGTRGLYTYTFAAVAGTRYSFLIDADPNNTGQVDVRYWAAAFDSDVELARELAEADEVYDNGAGLLHYYRKGTTVDLIPPKTVTGTAVAADTSLTE